MCLRKTLHWHFFYKGKKSKFHLKNDEGVFDKVSQSVIESSNGDMINSVEIILSVSRVPTF